MANKVKELRGQVRIAVKELLPEILAGEQFKLLEKNIMLQVNKILQEMNKRHKDTLGLLVRDSVKNKTV